MAIGGFISLVDHPNIIPWQIGAHLNDIVICDALANLPVHLITPDIISDNAVSLPGVVQMLVFRV